MSNSLNIGILCMQGAFIEHKNCLKKLEVNITEVRKVQDLDSIDGLIIPGGESTTIGKLLRELDILDTLKKKIISGLPVWGTCAGMILLAKDLDNDDRRHLETMDIKVRRNAYGTQIDSFKVDALIKEVSDNPIPLVFIRAPYIVEVGKNVEVLHELDGNIVAVKQDNMLATSFHPELTDNIEFHRYFVSLCKK